MNFKLQKLKFSDKLLFSIKILYPNALLRNCGLITREQVHLLSLMFEVVDGSIKDGWAFDS